MRWLKYQLFSTEKNVLSGAMESYQYHYLFVCVEVLRPSQPSEIMSSVVRLPNHTFTGQA